MKKTIKWIVVVATVITALPTTIDVYANEFADNESTYYALCSSTTLTNSQITTCREFSNYLATKKADADALVSDAKDELASANGSLTAIRNRIEELDTELAKTQEELDFLMTNIENLENNITEKDDIIRERMYAMQSSVNSNMFVQFIFGASSFGDLISRTDSIKELTSYDKELIQGLTVDREIVEEQKVLVEETKVLLEESKSVQLVLEAEAEVIYNRELAALEARQDASTELSENQQAISNAIAQSFANLNQTEGSGSGLVPGSSALGNAIASLALSKVGSRYWWGAPGGGYGDPSSLYSINANYFDCSGLVAWAHYHAGAPRGRETANTYSNMGTGISYSQLQAGDVITVNGGSGNAYHIGIYIGGGYLVHASGYGENVKGQYANQCVRVDPVSVFTNMGIKNYRRLY